jgi:tRNA A-37 threonylcarbamoyl transferase component Bud32
MNSTAATWVGCDVEDGRYRVVGLLGEGAMAYVYRALDRAANQDVVLKVPKPALLTEPEFMHRFVREIRALVELKHPAIVGVTGVGRHQGVPFAVLEFLPGGTLDERCRPAPPQSLAGWLPSVAAALDHIHANGFVHRDVKPANILIDAAGRARLSDFGIIKSVNEKVKQTKALTLSGMTVGTPEYMAPELAEGKSCDGSADQYALAVTVYQMLADALPITGDTPVATLFNQVRQTPVALDRVTSQVSHALGAAVDRGMAKDPKRRFPSCTAFAKAVLAASDPTARAATTTTPRPTATLQSAAKRGSPAVWMAAAAGIALAAAVSLFAFLIVPQDDGAPAAAAQPPVAAQPSFDLRWAPAKLYAGRESVVQLLIDRHNHWDGPVTLSFHDSDCVKWLNPPQQVNVGRPAIRARVRVPPTAKQPARLAVDAAAGDVRRSLTCDCDVGFFEVMSPPIQLTTGETKSLPVRLRRHAWDAQPIRLDLQFPEWITSATDAITFEPGADQAVLRLQSTGEHRGTIQLHYAGAKFAELDVSSGPPAVVARPKPREEPAPKPPVSPPAVGRAIGKADGGIVNLDYLPGGEAVVSWDDRSGLGLWPRSGESPLRARLEDTPLAGAISADGRLIATLSQGHLEIHTTRGLKRQVSGRNGLKADVLAVFFDSDEPRVQSTAGIHHGRRDAALIDVHQPALNSTTRLKYATGTSMTRKWFARSANGTNIDWVSLDLIKLVSPINVARLNLSHNGQALVACGDGQIVLWRGGQKQPAAGFPRPFANVAAVAVSPDGQEIAVGTTRGAISLVDAAQP